MALSGMVCTGLSLPQAGVGLDGTRISMIDANQGWENFNLSEWKPLPPQHLSLQWHRWCSKPTSSLAISRVFREEVAGTLFLLAKEARRVL